MELLDIVTENGIPTGETVERSVAHANGIRHRTSHVWILRRNAKGAVEVLLQKRSACKDSFPNCYDISSAGHIPAGSEFLPSALRELEEELGLLAQPDELVFCAQRRFFSKTQFHGKPFVDNQVTNVYCLWRDVDPSECHLQASEVSAVKWMDFQQCLDEVRQGDDKYCIYVEELEMIAEGAGFACELR